MTTSTKLACFLTALLGCFAVNIFWMVSDNDQSADAQQAPVAGVGYLHFDWPAQHRPNGPAVPLEFFYPLPDTTGLAPATFTLTDANGINQGSIPLEGVHAAGSNRITGQYPIIVIGHGAGAHGIGYYELARDLADAGNIVVLPTYRGDSLIEKSVTPPIPPDPWPTMASNRWYDTQHALNIAELIFGTLGGHTTGDAISMGHSFGALTALLMPTGTDAFHLPDARFDAVIAIHPALHLSGLAGYPGMDSTGQVTPGSHLDNLLSSLHKPTLLIGGVADGVVWPAIVDETAQTLTGTPWEERLDIAGSGHTSPSSAWNLLPGIQASTAPQAIKDHIAGTAAGACPDQTASCVPLQHQLQLDTILDFLDRALP